MIRYTTQPRIGDSIEMLSEVGNVRLLEGAGSRTTAPDKAAVVRLATIKSVPLPGGSWYLPVVTVLSI